MNRIALYLLMASGSVGVANSKGTDLMTVPPSPLTIEGVRDPLTGQTCGEGAAGAYHVRHMIIATHNRGLLGKPQSPDEIWDVTPVPPPPLPRHLAPPATLAFFQTPRQPVSTRRWEVKPVDHTVRPVKSKRRSRRLSRKWRPVKYVSHRTIASGGYSHAARDIAWS
jgi:hypothetical protein